VGELATQRRRAPSGRRPWRHEPDPNSLEAQASLGIDATCGPRRSRLPEPPRRPEAVDWTMDWYRRQAGWRRRPGPVPGAQIGPLREACHDRTVDCRFCQTPLTQTFHRSWRPAPGQCLPDPCPARGRDREGLSPPRRGSALSCFLVQADDPVAADDIFDDGYAYFSSYSESWVAHARRYAQAMTDRLRPRTPIPWSSRWPAMTATCCSTSRRPACLVLGIEPTANTAQAAVEIGVPTEVAFFNDCNRAQTWRRGDRR